MSTVQNPMTRLYSPGADITCDATAEVVARRFVKVSGPRGPRISVAHADAGSVPFGVSKYGAEDGQFVGVAREGILRVEAGAAITAGQGVEVGAAGVVVPLDDGARVGVAIDDAASGALADIALD